MISSDSASKAGSSRLKIRGAVFGTSRSGKDYTIRDASKLLSKKGLEFNHISMIKQVHQELNGRNLRGMSEEDKAVVMANVRNKIDTLTVEGCSFVDEHYCFPERYGGRIIENGYYGEKLPSHKEIGIEDTVFDVVFKDEWIHGYDLAVYMEIDPDVILERYRSSEGDKFNPFITAYEIRLWQLFELKCIQRICHENGIPLFYIYDHEKSGDELSIIVSHFMKHNLKSDKYKEKADCGYGE